MSAWGHLPVLYDETIAALDPRSGERYVDATLGAGGHAEGILDRSSPEGRLLGLDADPGALAIARQRLSRFGDRAVLVQSNFGQLATVAREHGFVEVAGVLFDLGLSSLLLESSGRGFSFLRDEPLDMRLDPGQPVTAAELVNDLSEGELARLLKDYGEEPRAKKIARAIVAARAGQPIASSRELAQIVASASHPAGHLHPATRTFQALRIAVNDELDQLAAALPQALEILAPGGRLAVISFHSLEDRIVKHFLMAEQRGCICPPKLPVCVCGRQPRLRILTKKPIVPSAGEQAVNPRSRSAKLRVAEVIGHRS